MAKYIVFDFDGTMVQSAEVFISAFNVLAARHGLESIGAHNKERLIPLSMRERMQALKVPFYKVPILIPEFITLYKQSMHAVQMVAGIPEVLAELNTHGYGTAIVSSNAVGIITAILEENGIERMTEVYSASRLFGKDKVIRKFLQRNKLQPADILYVGDELRDVVACKKLGVRIIYASWGFELPQVVAPGRPDFTAHVPADIVHIVRTNLL